MVFFLKFHNGSPGLFRASGHARGPRGGRTRLPDVPAVAIITSTGHAGLAGEGSLNENHDFYDISWFSFGVTAALKSSTHSV